MKPISHGSISVPSPTLLRFLRAQTDAQSLPWSASKSRTSYLVGGSIRAASTSTASSPSPSHANAARRHCYGHQPLRTTRETTSPPLYSQHDYKTLPSTAHRSLATSTPRRAFSTTRASSFWNIFGSKKRKPAASLQPDDLPPLASFLDDNGSLGRLLRPANELKLRCTEFDENGNVTLVNGEFKKSELIAKYGLLPRDLRKIDSSLLPHILVRPSAILLNLLHLRVLIKYNRVLVFDAYGSTDSYTQSVFMYDLEGKLRQKESRISAGSLPYEFRALEAVLISVTTGLESEFEGVREPVVRVLKELEEDIDRDKLRYLLIYSKKLGTFEQKARLVRDALDELLEADDDLAAMYLTEKAAGKERTEEEHEEVELLLESYHKVADEIVQAAENLVSSIRNTEEIVKAILDANRNSLMLLDLKFSIGTLGLGAGTFVAALYGMNLKNFIEESDLGFWGVSAWCAVFTAIVCSVGLNRLRKVQRVSMWGEGYQHGSPGPRARGRGSWRDVGSMGLNGGIGSGGPGALGPPPAGVGPFPGASVGASVAGLRGPEKRVERWRKAKELQAGKEAALRKRKWPGVEDPETVGMSTATGLGASAGAAVGLGTVTGGQEPQNRGLGDSEWPAHVGTPKPM